MSELMFYGGAVAMAVSALAAVISGVVFLISKRRLEARLYQEYGAKRH